MTSNKPNLFLITLACVFFVVILYLLSLISIKNNNQIKTPSLSPAPTILPTPQVKLVDTSDWKIYKNDTWNFSVKYPANWKVYSYAKPVVYLLPEELVEPAEGSVSVSLVLNVAEPRIPSSWTDYKLIDSKIYDGATWAARNNLNDQIYFWKNKIEVDGQITKSPLVTKEIFETILSTFKFLPEISTWKTYKNTKFGIEFNYPSDFSEVTTNIGKEDLLMLQGKDYKLVSNDFGSKIAGSFYYLSTTSTCEPHDIVGDKKVIASVNDITVYKITGYEGLDYKSSVIKGNNICFELSCFSETKCEGNQFADFNQILSTFKFIK